MGKIALFCPEPLGHRQPAGVGIRFLEMARVLRGDGHEVTVVSPDGGAVAGCRSLRLTPETIREVTSQSSAAVVQGHIANDLFAHGADIPTVVDLYDPFIVENLHYYHERGAEVFNHDHATLIRSMRRGDFFLCASESQRLFYLGAFLAIGRLNPIEFERDPNLNQLLAIAPFGVTDAHQIPTKDLSNPSILFGGIYDWYDPIFAIEAVTLARNDVPGLTLTFNHHPNSEMPQGRAAEAAAYVKERKLQEIVRFEPWIPYHDRAAFYDRFSCALLTFPKSLETDLAMRTRVLDYIWGGLPVISSSARGTDEIIEGYKAGIVVATGDASDFHEAILKLLTRDYSAAVEGCRRFARDHQWERSLAPLLEFCRNPRATRAKGEHDGVGPILAESKTILQRIRRRIRGTR